MLSFNLIIKMFYFIQFAVCKSCLVQHLEENNTCPTCEMVIHQSHPLQYISFDRTMQDIVYKLVPNLQDSECYNSYCAKKKNEKPQTNPFASNLPHTDEIDREREFYKSRNLPNPKDLPQNSEDEPFDQVNSTHVESDYHRQDEQVNVCLECISNNLSALKRKFIRCSSQATITHLKKFVAKKVLNGIDKYKDVSTIGLNASVRESKSDDSLILKKKKKHKNLFHSIAGRYFVQWRDPGQRSHPKIRIRHPMEVSRSTVATAISTARRTVETNILIINTNSFTRREWIFVKSILYTTRTQPINIYI